MDVAGYLTRIGFHERVETTLGHLERLQRAHLTAVPFENLDVFYRRGVSTEPQASIDKIVTRGRGGWCYELNGAFATLLAELGFDVRWLGAGVLPVTGPMPDHLAIEVRLGRPYLVDVGFGDSFIRPLPLDSDGPQDGGSGMYRLEAEGDLTTLVAEGPEGTKREYSFNRAETYAAADFEPSSHRLQTDPSLQWTQKPFATRLLDGGPDRVTLLEDRIKFRRNGVTTEHPVQPGEEWNRMLDEWFAMTP
ncbi:MAG: arylamine N-acetyltransferase [Acidimicrobiia bacterium]|nr:arylamine N-acetyltransferase [Acidimicrobiia bacterium]